MKKQQELVSVYDEIEGNKLSVIKSFLTTNTNSFNNEFLQKIFINDNLVVTLAQGSIIKTFEEWKSLIETNLNYVKNNPEYKYVGNNPINRATKFMKGKN